MAEFYQVLITTKKRISHHREYSFSIGSLNPVIEGLGYMEVINPKSERGLQTAVIWGGGIMQLNASLCIKNPFALETGMSARRNTGFPSP